MSYGDNLFVVPHISRREVAPMKVTDIGECVNRARIRWEVLPRYATPFDPEMFRRIAESFLLHAKGSRFYVLKTDGKTHLFAPHGEDVTLDLVFSEKGVEFFVFLCPIQELEEDDLAEEMENDADIVDPRLFITFDN